MNMKFGRTWLMLALALVMILSVTGGTIAWFTDSVESTGNVVKAGTLDVVLSVFDDEENKYVEIKNDSAPLFGSDILWEPGYTSAKQVKIENNGNLAFKYVLNVKPAMSFEFGNDESTLLQDTITLAKAIEVWLAPVPNTPYASFAELKAAGENAGTLYDLAMASMEDSDGAVYGVMLPEGKEIPAGAPDYVINTDIEYVLALHMKETAGNECQNLSISDGFVIELRATQYTFEQDSFGTDYDADATNDLPSAFVRQLDPETIKKVDLIPFGNSMSDQDETLNVGYLFATNDTPEAAAKNPYASWLADFTVSFDRDVYPGQIGLAGTYVGWGDTENWLGFDLTEDMIKTVAGDNAAYLPKGMPIRLLGQAATSVAGGIIPTVDYEDLCGGVVQFLCGAYDIDEVAAKDMTMTVQLSLFETEEPSPENGNSENVETGTSVTVGTFIYKF